MKRGYIQKTGKGTYTGQGYRTVWMKIENGRLSWSRAPGEDEKNGVNLLGYRLEDTDTEYFSIKHSKKRDIKMRVLKNSKNDDWILEKQDWTFQIMRALVSVRIEHSRAFFANAKRYDLSTGNHILAFTMYFNGVAMLMEAMKMGRKINDSMISCRKMARDAMDRMSEMKSLYPDLQDFVPESMERVPEQRSGLESSSSTSSSSTSKFSEEDSKTTSRLIGEIVREGIRRTCEVKVLSNGHTVRRVLVVDEEEELAEDAFVSKTRVKFRVDENESNEILFKSYADTVFAKLRNFALGRQGCEGFVRSLTSKPLTGGSLGEGKSGQLFFQSHDNRYILKTVSEAEHAFLLSFLPDYYTHISFFPRTSILCRFLFLMSFSCPQGDVLKNSKIRLVVMENCFYTNLSIHRTVKRSVDLLTIESLSAVTLKDLNFTDFDLVALQEHQRDAILKQLRQDTALLQAHNIMDYSLLLAVHHGTNQSMDRSRNVYFVYIVDILQYYTIMKKAETVVKGSLLGQGDFMSCVHPDKYKERFDKFMECVIVKSESNFGTLVLPSNRCLWGDGVSTKEDDDEIDLSTIQNTQ